MMKLSVDRLISSQIAQLLKIRRRIEALDAQRSSLLALMEKVIRRRAPVGKHAAPKSKRRAGRRHGLRKSVLRDALTGVLARAGKPLRVAEMRHALLAAGFKFKSKDPLKSLGVRLYTDKTFRKVGPGRFVLRKNK